MKNDHSDQIKMMNLENLKNVVGKADLTLREEHTLEVISELDGSISEDLVSIIRKARNTDEIIPAFKKKLVYTVRVFFTDGESEDFFTEVYDEIPSIKKKIRSLYAPEEIDEIVWDEDPEALEVHEFLDYTECLSMIEAYIKEGYHSSQAVQRYARKLSSENCFRWTGDGYESFGYHLGDLYRKYGIE